MEEGSIHCDLMESELFAALALFGAREGVCNVMLSDAVIVFCGRGMKKGNFEGFHSGDENDGKLVEFLSV